MKGIVLSLIFSAGFLLLLQISGVLLYQTSCPIGKCLNIDTGNTESLVESSPDKLSEVCRRLDRVTLCMQKLLDTTCNSAELWSEAKAAFQAIQWHCESWVKIPYHPCYKNLTQTIHACNIHYKEKKSTEQLCCANEAFKSCVYTEAQTYCDDTALGNFLPVINKFSFQKDFTSKCSRINFGCPSSTSWIRVSGILLYLPLFLEQLIRGI